MLSLGERGLVLQLEADRKTQNLRQDGKSFVVKDSWKTARTSHAVCGKTLWTGTTTFQVCLPPAAAVPEPETEAATACAWTAHWYAKCAPGCAAGGQTCLSADQVDFRKQSHRDAMRKVVRWLVPSQPAVHDSTGATAEDGLATAIYQLLRRAGPTPTASRRLGSVRACQRIVSAAVS